MTDKERKELEKILTIAIWGHWRDPKASDKYEAGKLAKKIVPYLDEFFERENRFYTPEDIAKAMQLDCQTILTYIRKGDLKAITLGKGYRILNKDFDDWVDGRKKI